MVLIKVILIFKVMIIYFVMFELLKSSSRDYKYLEI